MKRIVLLFVIAAMVVTGVIIWMVSKETPIRLQDILQFAVIFVIVAFALFLGYKRTRSYRQGEPQEDELSKKIMTKASSIAYYVSIYLWLGIMILSDKSKLATHSLIGAGILGMAVVFAICWIVVYFKGIRNE